jgi:molybdopterin converting factor subunit 1
MKVRVKLFAAAKDLAQRDELQFELPQSATIADVRRAAEQACPALGGIMPHAMWAVDAEYATAGTPLTEHSEVALIPPVSGG